MAQTRAPKKRTRALSSPTKVQSKARGVYSFRWHEDPEAGGDSVGYNDETDSPAAQEWKDLYSQYWAFDWNDDNYTDDLKDYYAFANTITEDAEVVLELGMLTNPDEGAWLSERLEWLGALVAHFLESSYWARRCARSRLGLDINTSLSHYFGKWTEEVCVVDQSVEPKGIDLGLRIARAATTWTKTAIPAMGYRGANRVNCKNDRAK